VAFVLSSGSSQYVCKGFQDKLKLLAL